LLYLATAEPLGSNKGHSDGSMLRNTRHRFSAATTLGGRLLVTRPQALGDQLGVAGQIKLPAEHLRFLACPLRHCSFRPILGSRS
jgi:hypothetical protein